MKLVHFVLGAALFASTSWAAPLDVLFLSDNAGHKSTNRIVLAERRDDKGNEPYTWVREVGKGRVFYTAWGHDQRTWSNPQFVSLIENGIRWAAAADGKTSLNKP